MGGNDTKGERSQRFSEISERVSCVGGFLTAMAIGITFNLDGKQRFTSGSSRRLPITLAVCDSSKDLAAELHI